MKAARLAQARGAVAVKDVECGKPGPDVVIGEYVPIPSPVGALSVTDAKTVVMGEPVRHESPA